MKKGIFKKDRTILLQKVKEAFSSVLPITIIVFILTVTVAPVESGTMLAFFFGSILVLLGTGIFTLGVDTGMTPIGEYIGKSTIKTKKLWAIIPIFFFVGLFITISEPDLQVLAGQLSETVDKWILLIAVGIGVGFFLVVAFLRTILKIKFSYIIAGLYALVFILSIFVPPAFVPLAFDSGGVTTGPMSVPFIIAIGTGIVATHTNKDPDSCDEFGLTALCSVGPIIAVMILGIIYQPENITVTTNTVPVINDSKELLAVFGESIPTYLKEVAVALLPIVAMFFVFHIFSGKIGRTNIIRILFGVLTTYIGLVLFLLGVNVGFLPMGMLLGEIIGTLEMNWIIIPIGMLLGYFVVAAEPAVHVLTKQVNEITLGAISEKALRTSLMIGVACSVGLAMTRILLHIPIMYILIPGYAIAIILAFIVPEIFTAIAFDSGGVASGAMTTSFILPLALGLCNAVGGNVATEGFGVVAFVAMTPLITIQILGLLYKIAKNKNKGKKTEEQSEEDIID